MARADAAPVVAVEVLEEQQVIAEVRIALQFLRPTEERTATASIGPARTSPGVRRRWIASQTIHSTKPNSVTALTRPASTSKRM